MGKPSINADVCIHPECEREQVLEFGITLCAPHMLEMYQRTNRLLEAQGRERWAVHVDELVSDTNPTRRRRKAAAAAVRAAAADGLVYFVRFGDRVKIGHTTRPDLRMWAVPWDEVLGFTPGDAATERAAHRLWAHLRVGEGSQREWFQDTPELRSWVRSLPLVHVELG